MQHNRSGAAQLLLASPAAVGGREGHHHHHHHHALHRHPQLHQIRGAVAAAAAASSNGAGGSNVNVNVNSNNNCSSNNNNNLLMGTEPQAGAKGALALALSFPDPSDTTLEHTVADNPVVVFSVSSCCLCHVVKKLFGGMGVKPTVIELDDMLDRGRAAELERTLFYMMGERPSVPAVFVGGHLIGGLDRLMAAHISGSLMPQLKAAGALYI